mmetsp:Transcript_26480/g.58008  ORF Transcript_26480/g.58008 Transcript_26480/m.58008 type:complete len:84 (-) Transcript_26480:743-994(-)
MIVTLQLADTPKHFSLAVLQGVLSHQFGMVDDPHIDADSEDAKQSEGKKCGREQYGSRRTPLGVAIATATLDFAPLAGTLLQH